MSRGFVKEEDQEEAPFVPPRASLPPGTTNYVTPTGQQELLQERELLEKTISSLDVEDEKEKRRMRAELEARLNLLNERIASARVLEPRSQEKEEVRFGAFVGLENLLDHSTQEFQIVGVDEADVKKKKISFLAPIARAVTGRKIGDTIEFRSGAEPKQFKILKIIYK